MGVRQLEGMSSEISLLHMNCEGCEWEMLENLLKDPDVISKVPQFVQTVKSVSSTAFCEFSQVRCLQVGTHYFPEVKLHKIYIFIQLIPVGAEPEQALLRHQRPVEFDSQTGVGGAVCLGGLGEKRIGR